MEKAVAGGDASNFKAMHKAVEWIDSGTPAEILANYCGPLRDTNFLLGKLDDEGHNPIYCAIRSGNVELLETIVDQCPGVYFTHHPEEMERILSAAYDELKLKNVTLYNGMELFVQNKLLNMRFFSKVEKANTSVDNIVERIQLVLDKIRALRAEYRLAGVDEKFIYMATFVTQNIHILKQQLKSTYNVLPWEEIEFCLVSFISAHTMCQEINLFFRSVLNKGNMLKYLENFSNHLERLTESIKSSSIYLLGKPVKHSNRDEMIADILKQNDGFCGLYNSYKELRDIYSLQIMKKYIDAALLADCGLREGRLVVKRALQVMGEHLKNSVESPKLSEEVRKLLLRSTPRETREILKELRNSLSHTHFILINEGIEECKLYANVQNDINKVGIVITEILFSKKSEKIKSYLTKIIESDSLNEVNEILEVFENVSLDFPKSNHGYQIPRENWQVVKLFNEIDNKVVEQTNYEKGLFKQINELIHKSDDSMVSLDDYVMGFSFLRNISSSYFWVKNQNKWTEANILRGKKYFAKRTLEKFSASMKPFETKNKRLLTSLLFKFHNSVVPRVPTEIVDRIQFLICLVNAKPFENDNLMWMDEFNEQLSKHKPNKSNVKNNYNNKIQQDQLSHQLNQKLSDLRDIISAFSLGDESSKNHKTKFMIEMILLDILSILDSSKCLPNNILFLDENAPLLSGRCLRNYLAHGTALFDLLYPDILITLLANAKSLVENEIINSKIKIGNIVTHNIDKLQQKHERGLQIVSRQEELTAALNEGNLEVLKRCLKEGADTMSKNIFLWTSFHMAAQGSNLEVIKLLFNRNVKTEERNIAGQVPLHIAASFGRANIVEFLVNEVGSPINLIDNVGKTPLHLAAQNGHQETVEKLLSLGASHTVKDVVGYSPVHYAARANYVDVVKLLTEKDVNVDANKNVIGFTCLHVAAEFGHLELVHYLLHENADVNAKTLIGARPMHLAALNGHLEVVKALINKGAQMNPVSTETGGTPLHHAVENGHENIVKIFLEQGAFVNIGDTYNYTPLHWAASNGHGRIVELLIKYKANVNAVKCDGTTPLLCAAAKGHLKVVELLIQNGSRKDSRDGNGWTALHLSIMHGHNDIVKYLIERGFNIHIGDKCHLTPLHVAVKFNNQVVVGILLAEGADVKSVSEDGSTPLHSSIHNGNEAITEALIEMGAPLDDMDMNNYTPLHVAVCKPDKENIIKLLIKHGSDVNVKGCLNRQMTPLHVASSMGHNKAVNVLIKNNAIVDAKTSSGDTPLYLAAEGNHKSIVEILVNLYTFTSKDISTALCRAVKNNYGELAKTLIEKGADVNTEGGLPLKSVISAGHRGIVDTLLKNKNINIDVKDLNGDTLLHLAAMNGNWNIGKALIKKGVEINSETFEKVTPLSIAVLRGNKEFVDMLLANGADVNAICPGNSSLLHIAISRGNPEIVESLLSSGVKHNIRDDKNRTALELAVGNSKLRIIEIFLQHCDININARGKDNWTVLHIAAQSGNLESIVLLIKRGADVDAKNALGSKPIHIAAREGFVKIVEFFLECGISIDDEGAAGNTLLHYAAMGGQAEVAQYLIGKCADINAVDQNGMQPIHLAAEQGQLEVLNVLLQSGAIYDNKDRNKNKPVHLTKNKAISKVLQSIENIFKAVKRNDIPRIEGLINDGAPVNAMSADKSTLLHLVCWKGYGQACDILLKNKANPNVTGKGNNVPLHYAAKFSHFNIVQSLLKNRAKYYVVTDNGKTPLDFATEKNIIYLLKLVDRSFRNVQSGNVGIVNDLKKIKDIDNIKAVMKARNKDGKSLVVVAIENDFPKVVTLKHILQENITQTLVIVEEMFIKENFTEALCLLKKVLDVRRDILGEDNPGTLDVLERIAAVLYAQHKYTEALELHEDIYQKQLEILGQNNKDSLRLRSGMALILHRQGKDQEAVDIFQDVYRKQKEILGENHLDVLNTNMHMALSLNALGKYEEALIMNRENYEKGLEIFGAEDHHTLCALNNVAMVLNNMKRHDEAFVIFQKVYETRKIILGLNHSYTLRAKHNMAAVLMAQRKSDEALKVFQEILAIQKNVLGPKHSDTLNTQSNIGFLSLYQNNMIDAERAFKAGTDHWDTLLGIDHPRNVAINELIKEFDISAKLTELDFDRIQSCQLDVIIAASKGDITVLENLIQNGSNVDTADSEGRTPLHFATSERHTGVVSVLLKRGADATVVTTKGNTPLHIAASRDCVEIAELLLQNVRETKQIRFNDFINAMTVVGGVSALHVACKKSSIKMVKCLLKYGACYNLTDRAQVSTPLIYSQSPDVSCLLQLTQELFVCADEGDMRIVKKLGMMEIDNLVAALNARDRYLQTPTQVAVINNHTIMANSLVGILKDKINHFPD